MTTIRYSANGGFNDTHLYVKYPDFAAPVPVLAEPIAAVKACEPPISAGEARESTHESYSQHQLKDWVADSRGERSNSDFAGGGTSGQGLGRTVTSEGATGHNRVPSGWVARGLQAVASKLSGGRWK